MKSLRLAPAIRLLLCLAACIAGAATAGAESPAFPEAGGWKIPDAPQTFSPKSLYQYINGAADLYLTYDFKELKVAEYRNDKGAAVTVEIYRHGTPTDAFGIYSQERLADARYLDIGAQGYQEPGVLNFLAGSSYVKMSGYKTGPDDEKIMLDFGRKIEALLGGKNSLPAVLSSFPQEGKKRNTEKYVAKDFLGYSYLHSGFTTDYEVSGKKFKLFAIEGRDAADCRTMVEKYLAQTKSSGKAAEGTPYRLKDPYHGSVEMIWKGKWIWGLLGLDDAALQDQYVKRLEEIAKK